MGKNVYLFGVMTKKSVPSDKNVPLKNGGATSLVGMRLMDPEEGNGGQVG